MEVTLKQVYYGGITLQIPEIWTAETETYDEPDGRQCACIDVSAEAGDCRSIMISYGPMPEGSDALMEVNGTYEEVMEDLGLSGDEESIFSCEFKGQEAYGFDFEAEEGQACTFICAGVEKEDGCRLFTLMLSAANAEDLDSLLKFTEEYITL